MATQLYWIETGTPGRLAIAPRPRGGDWIEDEFRDWKRQGLNCVVSLLEADEAAELGLTDEGSEAAKQGLAFLMLPVTDRGVPESRTQFVDLLSAIAGQLSAGESVVVHCRQGVGRASLVAIGILMRLGSSAEAALETVAKARGLQVPETAEQRRWISALADNAAPLPKSVAHTNGAVHRPRT